ncbi:MAG TPA: SusE domain-containing protein [Chitinophagaceae bacterium]
MKNIIKFFLTFLIAGVLFSCEKKIETISYEDGTAPALSADRAAVTVAFATQSNEALKLMWTNPNYRFSTGLSSQDVSYLVEMALEGTNFAAAKKAISLSKDLSIAFTQGELNDYLLNTLNLAPAVAHSIQFRVTSSLINTSVPLASNIIKFTITPYAIPPKVTPPASGELYIVGSATNGGWTNPVPVPSQKFTQVSPTLYRITVNIIGGNSYLLLPVNGDWGAKYGALGANNSNNPNEDDFKAGGGDLLAPSVSGMYTIEVDFQRGKFKLTL